MNELDCYISYTFIYNVVYIMNIEAVYIKCMKYIYIYIATIFIYEIYFIFKNTFIKCYSLISDASYTLDVI